MLLPVKTPEELGLLVRAARKADKLRMDDVAGAAGVELRSALFRVASDSFRGRTGLQCLNVSR